MAAGRWTPVRGMSQVNRSGTEVRSEVNLSALGVVSGAAAGTTTSKSSPSERARYAIRWHRRNPSAGRDQENDRNERLLFVSSRSRITCGENPQFGLGCPFRDPPS